MADETNQQGAADRSQVAADEGYEVAYFARKHGITQATARDLIATVGNDRDKLDAAAAALPKSESKAPPRRARATSAKARSPRKPGVTQASSGGAPSRRSGAQAGGAKDGADAVTAPAKPLKEGARSIRHTAKAAIEPLTDAVKPAATALAGRAKTVITAAHRSTANARHRVAAAPSAVSKRASKALDATKSAATSRTATLIGAAAAGLVTGLAVNLGRKAVVQAPSLMAGDWLEALKTEHALALAIFDKIEATSDAEPAKRALLLTQLRHALGKHAFTEENVIYPSLRDWGDKADADKLNHDHGYMKQYLFELDALDNGSSAFLARVAAFRADLEAHIREEEEAIFPPLHAALGDARNAEITALANKEGFKLA